jgi:methyl-accepting chemotaxis protein
MLQLGLFLSLLSILLHDYLDGLVLRVISSAAVILGTYYLFLPLFKRQAKSDLMNESVLTTQTQSLTLQTDQTRPLASDPVPFDSERVQMLLSSVVRQFNEQYDLTAKDLVQIRTLLGDAIERLTNNFVSLEARVEKQRELITKVTSSSLESDGRPAGGDGGNERINFSGFITHTSSIFAQFVENILHTSKRSIQLVDKMNSVIESTNLIFREINNIESFSRQTKFLALNASIESAKAGPMGRAFSVVADEIRKLANTTNQFSDKIRLHITEVEDSVKNATNSANDLASQDMSFALTSKSENDKMSAQIVSFNARIDSSLTEISSVNLQVKEHISNLITALQFEDLIKQLVVRIEQRSEAMRALLGTFPESLNHSIENNPGESFVNTPGQPEKPHVLESALNNFSQNIGQINKVSIGQVDVAQGSIELF